MQISKKEWPLLSFVIATFHPAVAALLDRFHAHAYLGAPLATDRAKNKARRANSAGLGHAPEEYLFIHESRFICLQVVSCISPDRLHFALKH
jgi:hypothetical protein